MSDRPADGDVSNRLIMTHAAASLNMHLVATTEDMPVHTLCGRAVAEALPPLALIETGCPDCALEAIALGVEVARDRDTVFLRLGGNVKFEF